MALRRLAGGKVVEERGIVDRFSLWPPGTAAAPPAGPLGLVASLTGGPINP